MASKRNAQSQQGRVNAVSIPSQAGRGGRRTAVPRSKPKRVRESVEGLRFIDLFAGIGGMRIAFERNGAQCVFSSEWDRDAARSYEANFGDIPQGDITEIDASAIPDHDLLVAGFPCQAFSIIGDKKGFADTRGTLFFDIERILRAKQPRAFLLENVKNLASHDSGRTLRTILATLDGLGYQVHWRVLNALDFGLPQKRERVIIVGYRENLAFRWPEPKRLRLSLEGLLEPDDKVDARYFASEKIRKSVAQRLKGKVLPKGSWICHENKSGNVSPLPYSCALRAGASYNYLLVNGVRRLTPRENLRLQGFPDSYPIVVSDAAIRKQAGNSVPVPMIEAVARELTRALAVQAGLYKTTPTEQVEFEVA